MVPLASVAEAVCELVRPSRPPDADPPVLTRLDLYLVNTVFNAGVPLVPTQLQQRFVQAGHPASYDPDSHPGLNVKIAVGDRLATALVFASGKIMIMAKTFEEQLRTHAAVTAIIDAWLHARRAVAPPASPL